MSNYAVPTNHTELKALLTALLPKDMSMMSLKQEVLVSIQTEKLT
jgi:hypothetical protein